MTEARFAGGVVTAIRHDPMKIWSRAVGFGFRAPITQDLVAELVDCFQEHRPPVGIVRIAPPALPHDWKRLAAEVGLQPGGYVVKLFHDLQSVAEAHTDLELTSVAPEDVQPWASTWSVGFGIADLGLEDMFAALPGS